MMRVDCRNLLLVNDSVNIRLLRISEHAFLEVGLNIIVDELSNHYTYDQKESKECE